MMQFIREIPEDKVVQKDIDDLTQFGFTLVWTKDSVQVYAQVSDTRMQNVRAADEGQRAA